MFLVILILRKVVQLANFLRKLKVVLFFTNSLLRLELIKFVWNQLEFCTTFDSILKVMRRNNENQDSFFCGMYLLYVFICPHIPGTVKSSGWMAISFLISIMWKLGIKRLKSVVLKVVKTLEREYFKPLQNKLETF